MHVDRQPVPAAIFDFALFFFHNARELLDRGSGPYFYLPKMQSHLEARLWNDVFVEAQAELGIPRGSIRVRFYSFHCRGMDLLISPIAGGCSVMSILTVVYSVQDVPEGSIPCGSIRAHLHSLYRRQMCLCSFRVS
jgi:hypothetical protein